MNELLQYLSLLLRDSSQNSERIEKVCHRIDNKLQLDKVEGETRIDEAKMHDFLAFVNAYLEQVKENFRFRYEADRIREIQAFSDLLFSSEVIRVIREENK